MSYSIDRSRAVSLSTHDGVWSLEVEELVRLNRNIFRPRRQRLSGREAILQHLATNQEVLLRETQRLLDGQVGDDAFRYELRGGDWVPVPTLQLVQDTKQAAEMAKAQVLADEVVELRARVDTLESSLQGIQGQLEQLLSREWAPSPGPQAVQPPAEPPENAPADFPDAVSGEQENQEPEAQVAQQPAAEPEAAPPPLPPDFPELKLPTLEALHDLVKGLIGDEVGMDAASAEDWNVSDDVSGYLAPLQDDAGEVVGAIALDLEATVRLAGGMLMEEEDVLSAQIAAGTPSEDVFDTASEVLNTLTSAVNKIKGNSHVRVGDLQHINASEHPWLCYSRKRDDFALSVGGRLAVFAR